MKTLVKLFLITSVLFIALPSHSLSKGPYCVVGGCSGELCTENNGELLMSTCVWQEGYECYKEAKCEVQSNGKCGWTQTEEYKSCVKKSEKPYPAPKGRDRWK